MKLLYIHHIPFGEKQANILQVLQMCEAFHRIGVDITLALPTGSRQISTGILCDSAGRALGFSPAFPIVGFPSRTILGHFKGIGACLGARGLLEKHRRVDACIVRSVFLCFLSQQMGLKTIYESHQATLNSRSVVLDRLYRWILLRTATHGKLLLYVAISQALGDIWVRRGVPVQKLLVLHDGFPAALYESDPGRQESRKQLGISDAGKIVTYAGSLYRDRGIENILRLANAFPDVSFYIIGGPDEEKQYWERRAKDGHQHNLYFTGHVPQSAVRTFLFASDILLMLWSKSVPTIAICSPLKVFEYMAAGRLIVGHGFPTIREVLEHGETAFLTAPGAYEDLEQKLSTALAMTYPNPVATAARRLAMRSYSWDHRAELIIQTLSRSSH